MTTVESSTLLKDASELLPLFSICIFDIFLSNFSEFQCNRCVPTVVGKLQIV